MSVYLCHQEPQLLNFEAEVLDSLPGRVVLSRSALHPGGGGQVCDQALVEYSSGSARIVDVVKEGARYWHILDQEVEVTGQVRVSIDAVRRSTISQLHTDSHILNALVYEEFAGALVTGAQINADGTARMDFDLPDADNDKLRKLEHAINDVIRQSLVVNATYVPAGEARDTHGLIRSQSVAPPVNADGTLRIIEITGLDRQACGGTHLANTGESALIRISKVENKGRHNRRIKMMLVQ